MKEQTENLIRELAEKLGTTAEHLWGVLIRQAGISGTINLLVCALWCAMLVWGYKLVRRKTAVPPETEKDKYPSAEWNGDGVAFVWAIWCTGVLITMLIVGCSLARIAGSILNPEYWALKQIVK